MRLQQKSLFRLLVDPFGRSARSLELVGTNLRMTRHGRAVEIPLQEVWAAPTVKHGMLGASLRILRWCDAPQEYWPPKAIITDGSGGATWGSSPG